MPEPERSHRDVVVALSAKICSFAVAVGLQGPVAVEVVGGDVEQHRGLGRELEGVLQLERGRLAHDRRRRARPCRRASSSAVPTLPATATGRPASRWMCPISSTVVVLPFVPGHGDELVAAASATPAPARPAPACPRARAAAITGASRGHARALDHRARAAQQRQAVARRCAPRRPRRPQRAPRRGRAGVHADHLARPAPQRERRRHPRAGQADHQIGPGGSGRPRSHSERTSEWCRLFW